jgi:predicted RNA-binding Zn ribbon-like protein
MVSMNAVRNSAGIDFVFSGDLAAVDLVNTEIVARRRRYDLLQTPQDVLDWFGALRPLRPEEDLVELEGMLAPDAMFMMKLKTFRSELRQLFGEITAGQGLRADEALDFLNTELGTVRLSLMTRNRPDTGTSGNFQMVYRAESQPGALIILTCAISAMRLLAERDLSRLHKCRNPHCVLFFYDLTRNATREWCSIECMDRARSAERYQQLKASRHDH